MTDWLIEFLFFIYTCLSIEYVNICFDFLDKRRGKVNVMVNKNIPFIPDVVRLKIELISNSYTNPLQSLKSTSNILIKTALPCNDGFVYTVTPSFSALQTVRFKMYYENEDFLIDEFVTALKPDFQECELEMHGLRENAKLKAVFIHQLPLPLYMDTEVKELADFQWNYYVRRLRDDEVYCLKFMTTEFTNELAIENLSDLNPTMPKYNLLTITLYKRDGITVIDQKNLLAEAYPCTMSQFLSRKLQIFVDPETEIVRFELFENLYYTKRKNAYLRLRGGDQFMISFKNINFIHLKISPMQLTQNILNRREECLLYESSIKKMLCQVRLPENFDKLELSYVEIRKFRDGVVKMKGYYLDMSFEQYQIFNIKAGRPSEQDLCKIEK